MNHTGNLISGYFLLCRYVLLGNMEGYFNIKLFNKIKQKTIVIFIDTTVEHHCELNPLTMLYIWKLILYNFMLTVAIETKESIKTENS